MTDADTETDGEAAQAAALAAADDALAGGRAVNDATATYLSRAAAESPDPNAVEFNRDITFIARVRAALGPPVHATGSNRLPWERLGRFNLRRELGRGGMGIVFLADDPLLDRQVAIKVPRPEMLDTAESRERFRREARAASALDHPNIVPVFEAGAEGPIHYLVAAYCAGPSLAAWLAARTEPVPLTAAADMVAELADAITHAHDRGIVHRDVKPSNVLLSGHTGAVPRITDFGLAKLADDVTATRTGAIVGTVAYMAPEQAVGRGDAVGPAADIYALGAVFYELLTGRPPFVGDSELDVLAQVRGADPVSPALLRRTVPRDLETVCLKCLRKEPEKRYTQVADLANDLRRWRRGEPVRARPVSTREQAWRWCRRNPALATLATAVVLLLSALAVGSTFAALWLRSGRDSALAAEERSERRRFDALVAQARAGRWGGQVGRRFASLDALGEAAGLCRTLALGDEVRRELRTEVLACLPLVDVRTERAWDGFPADGAAMTFDDDLQRYAIGNSDGRIIIHEAESRQRLADLRRPDAAGWYVYSVVFSPGGRILAAHYIRDRKSSLLLWDWQRGDVIMEFPPSAHVWVATFHPDGNRVAISFPDGSVRLRDLTGRTIEQTFAAVGHNAASARNPWLRFDAAGQRLAVKNNSAQPVQVWDVSNGRLEHRVPQSMDYGSGAWGRDGVCLAIANSDYLEVWEPATGTKRATLIGHQSGITAVTLDPLQQFLVSKADDASVRLWDVETQRQVLEFSSEMNPQFNRDGSRVARRIGSRFEILALHRGAECRRLPWPGKFVAFADDGAHLALADSKAGIRLIDLAADRCLAHWPIPEASAALISPDRSGLWAVSEGAGLHRLPWPTGVGQEILNADFFPQLRGTSLAGSRDGRRMIAVLDAWVVAFNGATGTALNPPMGLNKAYFAAISTDGRFSAAGPWGGSEIRVWDGSNQTPVLKWALPSIGGARVAFSPDGRWFAVSTDSEYLIFEPGSWKLRHRLACRGVPVGTMAFSPDGLMFAASHGRDAVRLFDMATGAEIATLPSVTPEIIWSLAFSSDNHCLATGTEHATTHLWDLRRIRARLVELGLDW